MNTPLALSELSAIARAANSAKKQKERVKLRGELLAAGALLGLLQQSPDAWFDARFGAVSPEREAEIDAAIAERKASREAKDFTRADGIRAELAATGIFLEDGADATTWRRGVPVTDDG